MKRARVVELKLGIGPIHGLGIGLAWENGLVLYLGPVEVWIERCGK